LGLDRSPDNGGVAILDYELWIGTESGFTICTTYDYSLHGFSFAVVATANSLTPGSYYTFKFRSKNERGYSDFSDILSVGLGPLPSQPTGLVRAIKGNGVSSIALDWNDLTGETLDVAFYSLFVDDGQGVIFTTAYQGSLSDAIVRDLMPGVEYSFYVTATNFNGEGVRSDIIRLKSCIVPIGVHPPELLLTTIDSVRLRWTHPDSDGGCPVSSFSIITDLGVFGAFTTDLDAASIANKPYLFEHTFSLTSAETGKLLRFKLTVSNERGSTTSEEYLTALIADVP